MIFGRRCPILGCPHTKNGLLCHAIGGHLFILLVRFGFTSSPIVRHNRFLTFILRWKISTLIGRSSRMTPPTSTGSRNDLLSMKMSAISYDLGRSRRDGALYFRHRNTVWGHVFGKKSSFLQYTSRESLKNLHTKRPDSSWGCSTLLSHFIYSFSSFIASHVCVRRREVTQRWSHSSLLFLFPCAFWDSPRPP